KNGPSGSGFAIADTLSQAYPDLGPPPIGRSQSPLYQLTAAFPLTPHTLWQLREQAEVDVHRLERLHRGISDITYQRAQCRGRRRYEELVAAHQARRIDPRQQTGGDRFRVT